jgi:3-dehydro-L-gulonate 2-dehydrogenase
MVHFLSVIYLIMQKTSANDYIAISPEKMESEFYRILINLRFAPDKARTCAQIFTNNTLEGVYTHGVYRFPRFVEYVKKGFVKPDHEAICKHTSGVIEQWDGQSGPGPINALICTDRSMELASKNGMGCVALANANHWMRGGAYGWKAAKAGFAFIGWTNTIANMPAWGAIDSRLGNNPLVIAIPFENDAIVLDMAMSQYSYGALELSKLKNEKLPVPGGYDEKGNLTQDPESIIKSRRPLPIGYWKGTGLSLLLDLLGAILSGGLSTEAISKQPAEYNVSQIFISINLAGLHNYDGIASAIHHIIDDYHQSMPESPGKKIRYPGERALKTREENRKNGIAVLRDVWDDILKL